MMYHKAVCFQDGIIAEQILAADDVAHIKELGRTVSGYNDNIWNGVRQLIVYEGLLAKFSQQDELKRRLLQTRDMVLCQDLAQNKMRSSATKLLTENRPSHTFFRSR